MSQSRRFGPRHEELPRVRPAVPGGLEGYVGHSYDDATDLSGGQWQILGLARALMRRHPLLLILDEPAAALDASAEHDLFERYASAAGREDGGVTVLISQRLTEYGTHRELMDGAGLYAELFTLQARAYQ
jgi:ATP-binding cassette subfamily B protein